MSIQLGQLVFQKETLHRVLDFLPYPFLVSHKAGPIRYNSFVNQNFLQEIGYTLDEIPTINEWFELAYPSEEYRALVMFQWDKKMRNALLNGEDSIYLQVKLRTKDYGDKWYEVKASITEDVQMVAFININNAKLKEEELKKKNQNRDRILSILGHDLRIPVAHLHMLSQMALKGQINQQEYTNLMEEVNSKAFQNMEFLTNTLTWAKSNFDSVTINFEEVEVSKLVDDITALYSGIYQAKDIRLVKDIDPSFLVRADKEILTSVIRNLLSNAIKFSQRSGYISISAFHEERYCYIVVSDTGIGMSAEKIQQIHSRQYASESGTSGEKGLGIGLQLSTDILTQMDAQLIIESVLGEGTMVKIRLKK